MKPLPYNLRAPWAITEDWLKTILAIQQRGEVFGVELGRAREAWQARKASDLVADTSGVSGVLSIVDGVAVVSIQGPLMRHASMFSEISGATSYDAIWKALEVAAADSGVGSVLLRVSSPGGEADGCGELADYIANFPKPVHAYIESMGASAAYWLASQAKSITAHETAEVGSIGVRFTVIDDSKADEMAGERAIEIVSSQSPRKRGTPVDDAVISRIQTRADDLAAIFVSAVARGRDTDAATVAADFDQGDVMIASKALAAGMVDSVGDFNSTLAILRGRPATTAPAPVKRAAGAKGHAMAKEAKPRAEDAPPQEAPGFKCATCKSDYAATEPAHCGKCMDDAGGEDEGDEAKALGNAVAALTGQSGNAALGVVAAWKSDADGRADLVARLATFEAERASAVQSRTDAEFRAALETGLASGRLTLGECSAMVPIFMPPASRVSVGAALSALPSQTAASVVGALCSVPATTGATEGVQALIAAKGSATALPRAAVEHASTEANLDKVKTESDRAAREGGLVDNQGGYKPRVHTIAALKAAAHKGA